MAPLRLWTIRPQPDHNESTGCGWNDNQAKTMKQSGSSGPRLLVYLAIAALALGIGYRWVKSGRNSPPAPDSMPAPSAGKSAASEDAEPREVSLSQFKSGTQPPAANPPTGRSASSARPIVARTEPTAHTRQLVAGLTNLDFSH